MSGERPTTNGPISNWDKPTFSVIIPAYNRAELIPRATQSVLRQTFSDFELIIVDDGSTDNTRQVVGNIKDPRLRIVHQENKGVSAARNTGVAAARGRYITFLDSDDAVLPNWLTCFLKGFERHQAGLVFVGYVKIIEQGGKLERVEILPSNFGPLFDHQRMRVHAGTFAMRRELFDAVGGYADGLAFAENTEFLIRLVAYCIQEGAQIESLDEPLILYYKQPFDGSKAHTNYGIRLQSLEYILACHRDKFQKDPRMYGMFLTTAGVTAAKMEAYDQARGYLRLAIQTHPWNWKHYGRLLLASVPKFGRRYWLRHKDSDRMMNLRI